MKLSLEASERLSILRFPLIVGVVFIHAYGFSVGLSDSSVGPSQSESSAALIQTFFSHGLARLSVPLFFLISGFLFFNGFQWSYTSYKDKLTSRFKTLVVPFLFWNMLILLFLLVAQGLPFTQGYFSGENQLIASFNLYDFFNAFFGIEQSPIAYQFWFIRDLIVMVVLTPLISWILQNKIISKAVLLATLLIWMFDYWPIYIPSGAAFLFFYVGAFLASNNKSIFALDKWGKGFCVIYILILIVDIFTKDHLFNTYIHHAGILLGISALLYLSKIAQAYAPSRQALLALSGYSFFVFAVHEPSLIILKKVLYQLVRPQSDVLITFLYFLIPITIIILSIYLYKVLNLLAPKTLKMISGGR